MLSCDASDDRLDGLARFAPAVRGRRRGLGLLGRRRPPGEARAGAQGSVVGQQLVDGGEDALLGHAAVPAIEAGTGRVASISISRSSVMSGNACISSGQASRGNSLRCFHTRTAPALRPTCLATAAGPPLSWM